MVYIFVAETVYFLHINSYFLCNILSLFPIINTEILPRNLGLMKVTSTDSKSIIPLSRYH